MTLAEVYGGSRLAISFELFPPKTAAGERALEGHVERLMEFSPSYLTCTYGAGGSTREKTLDVIRAIKQRHGVPVATHLTCVGSTRDQLREFLRQAVSDKVDYVVALRGDPPADQPSFQAVAGGLQYADQLVSLIHTEFPDFGIAVAGYPEVHQEAADAAADLSNLKRKVDSGADVVITQLFYNNDDFFRFRDRYLQAGIDVPLVPGILPVTGLAQIRRITSMCGASLPAQLVERLAEQDDADWQFDVGVEFAIEQVRELIEQGVPGLHFFVLNRSQATTALLEAVRSD
jgi:methylenetetrahydrofolate reductase (NADPH)